MSSLQVFQEYCAAGKRDIKEKNSLPFYSTPVAIDNCHLFHTTLFKALKHGVVSRHF